MITDAINCIYVLGIQIIAGLSGLEMYMEINWIIAGSSGQKMYKEVIFIIAELFELKKY